MRIYQPARQRLALLLSYSSSELCRNEHPGAPPYSLHLERWRLMLIRTRNRPPLSGSIKPMKRKPQNTSHAVMAQRIEGKDSLDNFPTPPWATRALIEKVLPTTTDLKTLSCLEPACGQGHMAKVLKDYFGQVDASDVHTYGYGAVRDFLYPSTNKTSYDWIITNPPFRLAEQFVHTALEASHAGTAILVRTTFIESVGRYNNLFARTPPSIFAQFVERVPMVKGRLDSKASTATGYCWLVWIKGHKSAPKLVWIPPCRKALERVSDYEPAELYVPAHMQATSHVHGRTRSKKAKSPKRSLTVLQSELFEEP
jgi:hypothetical protein